MKLKVMTPWILSGLGGLLGVFLMGPSASHGFMIEEFGRKPEREIRYLLVGEPSPEVDAYAVDLVRWGLTVLGASPLMREWNLVPAVSRSEGANLIVNLTTNAGYFWLENQGHNVSQPLVYYDYKELGIVQRHPELGAVVLHIFMDRFFHPAYFLAARGDRLSHPARIVALLARELYGSALSMIETDGFFAGPDPRDLQKKDYWRFRARSNERQAAILKSIRDELLVDRQLGEEITQFMGIAEEQRKKWLSFLQPLRGGCAGLLGTSFADEG